MTPAAAVPAAATPRRRDAAAGARPLLEVQGQTLRLLATLPVGGWTQGFAFSRDGKTILLQDMVHQQIEVFQWDGKRLTEGKPLAMGIGPAAIRTSWP